MSDILDKLNSLWRYTKVGRKRIYPAVSMMIVGSLIFATLPVIAKSYIDEFLNQSGNYDFSINDLLVMLAGFSLMVIAWFVLYSYGRNVVINDVSGRLMRDAIADKAERISVASLEDHHSGDMTALMAYDVPNVIKAMRFDIPNFFVQLALLIFIIVMMFYLNITLALVYLILLAVSYVVTRRIGDRMHRQMEIRQESMGRLNGYFNDVISSHSLVKIYGLEDKVKENFDRIDEIHSGSYIRTTSMSGFIEPFSRIIDNVGYFVTAVMGAVMIINGDTTFGTFLAFISYAAIIGRPLVSFTDSINRIQNASVSYDRICDYLDEIEMPNESAYESIDKASVEGEVTFNDVSFTYPDGTKALEHVDFTIRPGSIVTIIGEEGSGKSTVSDLIMGFRTATEGEVLLDGRNIADIRRSDLRSVIGISLQDPFIFEGSVYYNLSQTVSDEDIVRMSEMTGLDRYVRRLPKGYDTVVGGRGHGLSSGETQMLSITRLLLHDPKVMIFDESSSEMDPLTSMNAFSSIRDRLKNKTLIIVDNTPVSVMHADTVIFMGKGKVLDIGTHSELMDRNPQYVEMYRNMVS